MARFALYSILAIALITGIVFAANPGLDVEVAGYFFRPDIRASVNALRPTLEIPLVAASDLATAKRVYAVADGWGV